MRRSNVALTFSIALALQSAAAQEPPPVAVPPKYETGVAAKVNRDIITKGEVWKRVRSRLPFAKTDAQRDALFNAALEDAILEKVREQAIERMGVRVDSDRLRRAVVDSQVERMGGSSEFQSFLAESGQSEREFVDALVGQIEQRNVLRVLYGEGAPVGDRLRAEFVNEPSAAEVRAFYSGNASEFLRPPRAKIQYIALRRAQFENRWRATLDEANRVREELRTGAELSAIAERYEASSQSGAKPVWVEQGTEAGLPEEVETFAFGATAGAVSEALQFERGYYVARVLERQDAEKVPFRQAQDGIRTQLSEANRKRAEVAVGRKFLEESYIWPIQLKEVLLRRP